MDKENKKILPEELDTDQSLPGRFEESNSAYVESGHLNSRQKSIGIYIMIFAFLFIATSFFSYYFLNQNEINSNIIENALVNDPEKKLVDKYNIGKYGSEHSHAAILIVIDDNPIDFSLSRFQLASKYIHFENHNSYMIHKHATGVPLEMLLFSLGMKVTPECIALNHLETDETKTEEFCSDQEKSLLFYLNGEQYHSDISQHIIKQNDRILISFGDGKSIKKQIAYLNSLEIFQPPKNSPRYPGDGIVI